MSVALGDSDSVHSHSHGPLVVGSLFKNVQFGRLGLLGAPPRTPESCSLCPGVDQVKGMCRIIRSFVLSNVPCSGGAEGILLSREDQ